MVSAGPRRPGRPGRSAFQARARNNDYRSRAQADLSNGLVDYYMSEYDLEEIARLAVEYALIFGEGWVGMTWDVNAGDEIDAVPELDEETGEQVGQHIIHAGDLRARTIQPIDVIRDAQDRRGEHNWVITRTNVSKWDLAVQFPDHEQEILNADTEDMRRLTLWSRDGATARRTATTLSTCLSCTT